MGPGQQGEPNNLRLDTLDHAILRELMRDARIPNNTLASGLRVAASTTLTRVRRLTDAGVIRGSHASVDLTAMGLSLQALISVQLKPMARHQIRSFASRAAKMPMVRGMFYLGGGELDFLIYVACPSTEKLNELVTEVLNADPVVAGTRTYLVFDYYDQSRINEIASTTSP